MDREAAVMTKEEKQNKSKAQKYLTDSDGYVLITVQRGEINVGSYIENLRPVEAMGLIHFLMVQVPEIAQNKLSESEEEEGTV
jgi:hypothetical protein